MPTTSTSCRMGASTSTSPRRTTAGPSASPRWCPRLAKAEASESWLCSTSCRGLPPSRRRIKERFGSSTVRVSRTSYVSDQKIEEYKKYIENVAILQALLAAEKEVVAKALVEMHFRKGQPVGNTFYILYEGSVDIVKEPGEEANIGRHIITNSDQCMEKINEVSRLVSTNERTVHIDQARDEVVLPSSPLSARASDIAKLDFCKTAPGNLDMPEGVVNLVEHSDRDPDFRGAIALTLDRACRVNCPGTFATWGGSVDAQAVGRHNAIRHRSAQKFPKGDVEARLGACADGDE
ncbi:unnamed protein product [Prorocentrum cordatum]|uniref:Cyclic nucleotide-binding domain-containing protein n=1 Tax=Prorocentrum cordatum TaxID=2364126 RepID=A0ABN9PK60_9DINO|nr:unnamed protein product [Polarella glacialis]